MSTNLRWTATNSPNQDDPDQLARMAYSSRIADGAVYGNDIPSGVETYMSQTGANPAGMKNFYQAAETMHDPGKGFWAGLVDKSMAVFDTLAIPQQIGFQLLTGGDWRDAIPTFFAKEEWAKEGVHHEIIRATDVLNVWSDGALDEWYEENSVPNQIGELVFKTAGFVADIFTDPLTYVPMAGAVKVLRRTLPLGVQAEFLGKIALKTQKAPHAAEALEVAERFLAEATERAAKEGTERSAQVLSVARKNFATMKDNDQAVRLFNESADEVDKIVSKAPIKEGNTQVPLGPEYTDAERLAAKKAYVGDKKFIRDTVRGMDDEVTAHNIAVQGVDDAGQISEGLAQLALGTDPADILIRNPRIRHHYNSMNLPPDGIAFASREVIEEGDLKIILGRMDDEIAVAEDAFSKMDGPAPGVPWKGLTDEGRERFAPWKRVEKDIERLKRARKATAKNKTVSDDVLREADLLPQSYRRSPLEADDYIDSQFGKMASRVAGISLYPKAVMSMPPGWFNHVFREPTRVLSEQSPEMRMRLMDGLKQYNYGLNYTRKASLDIMERAGIYKTGTLKQGLKRTVLHNANGTVDTKKAAELTSLLDAKYAGPKPSAKDVDIAQDKFNILWEAASPEMRQAHDEMRELLDAMVLQLGIEPDKYIKGYVPHLKEMSGDFLDPNWHKNGSLPPDMEGLSSGKVFFGNEMERVGADFDETDIAKIMDVYTRGHARKLYIEPMNRDLQHMARKIALDDPSRQWLQGFTDDLVKNINGTPSSIAKIAERVIGSDRARLAKSSAGMVSTLGYSAALTGNLRYPVMSVLQSLNTTSAKYGPLRTLKGVAKMMSGAGRKQAIDAGIDNEITQIYSGISSWAGRLKPPGGTSIAEVEFNIRGLTYHAALGDELKRRGFKHIDDIADEAERHSVIAFAVRETEEANHIFGAIGRPVLFSRLSRTGATAATQFFSFPFKQTETLLAIGMENPGAMMDYLYMAGKMQTAAADGLNIDISDYVGVGFAADIPKIISGERATIPVQAFSNMHKFLSTIPKMLDGADPIEMRDAKESFFSSLEMMVPGKIGAEQIYKGFNEVRSIGTTGKAHVRKARRTSLEALGRTVLGQGSFNELKFGEIKFNKTQADFASIVTGMNTIQGKIERGVSQATFKRKQTIRALQVDLTEQIWDVVRTGNDDMATINKLVRQLRGLGVNYKDLSAIADRQTKLTYAANMTVKAREQLITAPADRRVAGSIRYNVESRAR